MRNSRNALLRWLLRLCILTMLIPATNGSAIAQDYTYAGEWEVTFEIVNGKIQATWIGRAWENEGGVETDVATKIVDISANCTVFGAPVFSDDAVTLDGVDDYISCKIPAIGQLFASVYPLLRQCRCYFEGPPYASADISPVYSTEAQPVVFHNRLFLEVMHVDTKSVRMPLIKTLAGGPQGNWLRDAIRVDANNSLGIAQLTLNFLDGEVLSWQSNRFSIWQQNGFQLWAGYNAARYVSNNTPDEFNAFLADNGFWEQVDDTFTQGVFFWESEAVSRYVDEPMPSGFGLEEGTNIYIGHNPLTGTFFEGTIRAAAVDPGCRGH